MSSLQATPRDVTEKCNFTSKKICPGETRIPHQLALQCLQVGGSGWSGVEVAASGSHLVRSQRKEGGRNCHKKANRKERNLKYFLPGELANGSVADRPKDSPLWPQTHKTWSRPKIGIWASPISWLQSEELDRRHGESLQHPGRRSQGRYLGLKIFVKNISLHFKDYQIDTRYCTFFEKS